MEHKAQNHYAMDLGADLVLSDNSRKLSA
ncbi:hypothetical protein CGLO_04761 [Colletotrichum gloeosporioides Cg-14]|uniref:Uncharacterized protein n=1 Tax=Colletotrichum gloeosporioides (strain Cg-14) TaxID=1237896 RepID=T0KT88_COLGC|nr:hypothetical protein CGLO_04761 [Colletotrichum gloeosporioides Cg-14]